MSQSGSHRYDHYGEAKTIAALLAKEGLAVEGKEIMEAMTHFSGTEIFMHLRHALARLRTHKAVSDTTRKRIQMLQGEIDEALKK